MPTFAAKDLLSDVIGLKNDIVFKVFTCPDSKIKMTISRWQAEGQLAIVDGRSNIRYWIKGESVVQDEGVKEYYLERSEGKRCIETNNGYKVFAGLGATQRTTAIPKDSFLLVMQPELAAAPKPVAVPPAARPAGAPAVPGAPAAAAPKPAVPAPAPAAPKPAGDTPAA
jgi:hypothetical protein